jgi:transposase, IS30 family
MRRLLGRSTVTVACTVIALWRHRLGGEATLPRPTARKLDTSRQLHGMVHEGLQQTWSPKQISCRLREDYPDDPQLRVSHETIDECLYLHARGQRRTELTLALRQEGDLIIGKGNKSQIATLVERTACFLMLVKIPYDRTAERVAALLAEKMQTLPEFLQNSVPWDQGKEMARHADFTVRTGMPVYFCDPHSPWQRGSNENTNELLHQYFPKGTDLSLHSQEEL